MKSHRPDNILLAVSIILVILGISILASVSTSYSQTKFGSTFYLLVHQITYGLIPGLILGAIAYKMSLAFLKKWSPILFLINLILLALVFLPKIGFRLSGAARWIKLGPFLFQPSEFLKITFILYLAAWLVSIQEKKSKRTSRTFIAFFAILGIIGLILSFQPDISTLGIIILTAILMYFMSDTPFWHIILIVIIGAGILVPLISFTPYRLSRISVFLNPDADPMGEGYHLKQALITTGSGGILGLGLGMSQQKFEGLPESISDTIFVVFAEETGFIGCLILIALFLVFLWRAFVISKKSQDNFSKSITTGIGAWIIIQAFINIGGMIGIFPVAGVPLPFVSYGGSAEIAELIGLGLLLNVSKNTIL